MAAGIMHEYDTDNKCYGSQVNSGSKLRMFHCSSDLKDRQDSQKIKDKGGCLDG